jgi:uncharacterized membrane protein
MKSKSKEDGKLEKVKRKRVVFIDQARALALTMMLFGHTLHAFLGEPWRLGKVYNEYQFYRGITSALFLMVSGFSFVVASFKYWDDYIRLSPRLLARLRRIAYVLFFGYFLHLYGGTLSRMIFWYTPEKMVGFLRFNVLQNIGYGLIILHLIAFASRKMEHFWKVTLLMFFGVIFLAALTYNPELDQLLPHWIAPALNLYHRSTFPLLPYSAYMLVGAFFAYFFWKGRQKGTDWKAMVALALTGLAMILFEYIIRNHIDGGVFPYSSNMPRTPGNTFTRCGHAMLIISAFYFIEKFVVILPRLSLLMSKESLAIYVVHIPIVYGGSLGFFGEYRRQFTPSETFLYFFCLMAAMLLMAWILSAVRDRSPSFVTKLRRTLLIAWSFHFVTWSNFDWHKVIISLILGIFIMQKGPQKTVALFKKHVLNRYLSKKP